MPKVLRVAALGGGLIVLLLLTAFLAEWPPFDAQDPDTTSTLESETLPAPPPPAPLPVPSGEPVEPQGEATAPEALPPPPPARPEPAPPPPPVAVKDPPVPASRAFHTDATGLSGKEIVKARDKAVAWLRKKQARSGSWGSLQAKATYGADHGGYPAGPTALALYALLSAHRPLKDPVVKKGFAFLHDHFEAPASAYETSMLLLAVTATGYRSSPGRSARPRPPKLTGRFRAWAHKLADHLVERRTGRGWRYNDPAHPTLAGGGEDLSSTQLAALALLSAQRVGIRVVPAVWEAILGFSRDQQDEHGTDVELTDPEDATRTRWARARGFTYVRRVDVPDRGQTTGAMTACGIANLLMARHVLTAAAPGAPRPEADVVAAGIRDAFNWLEHRWSPFENPGKGEVQVDHYYWLWMLECAADLADAKQIGRHAWYVEMGRQLIQRQHRDGHWEGKGSWKPADTLDTAFALLFLWRAARHLIPTD